MFARQNLWSRDILLKGQFMRGQILTKPFSSNPELHLKPWISKSFKLVVLFPRNCGLGGSHKTEFQPLQFSMIPVWTSSHTVPYKNPTFK